MLESAFWRNPRLPRHAGERCAHGTPAPPRADFPAPGWAATLSLLTRPLPLDLWHWLQMGGWCCAWVTPTGQRAKNRRGPSPSAKGPRASPGRLWTRFRGAKPWVTFLSGLGPFRKARPAPLVSWGTVCRRPLSQDLQILGRRGGVRSRQ